MLKDSTQSSTSQIPAMDVPFILYLCSAFLLIIIQFASAVRCPDISVRFGRVKYRSRGRVAIFGCWTGFLHYGEKYAGCFRGAWDVTPPKCVRKGCMDVSFNFGTVRKPLQSTAILAFRCFQGYDLVGPREIFCDGTSYDTLPPVCRRTETDISCDFENNNLCKWRSENQNLTFQLRNTATPSRILNTGPDHDHTLDPETNGYYIYLETSSTIPGEKARITTPYLPHAADTNTCFKFWYHMFGMTTGTLRVYINDTVAFERTGNRGDRWRLGKARLPDNSHFKIAVEAITGRGYLGDIALDDFDVGECSDSQGNTCAHRCSEDESDLFASCNCHPGCVEESTCCSDFQSYCIAETTAEFFEGSVAPSELTTALEETTEDTTVNTIDDEVEGIYRTDTYTGETEDNTEINTESKRFDDGGQTVVTEVEREIVAITEIYTEIYTGEVDETTIEYDQSTSYKDNNVEQVDTSKSEEIEKIYPLNIMTPRYNLRPRTSNRSLVVPTPALNISSTTLDKLLTIAKETRPTTFNLVITTGSPLTTRILAKEADITRRTTTSKPTARTLTTTRNPTNRTTATMQKPTTHTTTTTQNPTIRTTTTMQKPTTYTTTTTLKPTSYTTTTTQTPTTRTTSTTQKPTTSTSTTTRKPTTRANITTFPSKATRILIPIKHQSVTVSMKDPKITTRSLPKLSTVETPIVIKLDESNETLFILPTETQTDLQTTAPEATKWVSTYKKKGAFKLVDLQSSTENTDNAGITTAVAACLVMIVGSAIVVILFMRKRRLSSGPSDGADIVFIPADELLDFTPAGANRDSGVYSDTVMSLKRDKGSKGYKAQP